MRLAHLVRTLLLTSIIATALLATAAPASASCKYQGSLQAGKVDCVRWADEQSPGGSEQTQSSGGSVTSPVIDVGSGSGSSTSNAPVCRDSTGVVVPCTITNGDGNQCYFGGNIGATPGGSGSGSVYMCPPPPDGAEADAPPGSAGQPATPTVDPVILAWRATASMGLRAVDMQIAPAPVSENRDAMGLVGLPVWMWADQTAATWGPQTASASDGPVNVTVTARVDRVQWDMGDGTVITCDQPGTPFDPARHTVDDESPDCGHTYLQTSSRQPDGLYTVTATSHWIAQWTDDTGQSGTIPFELTTSEQIRIGELQVLRTANDR
jgi:hypothetical protein